MSILRQYLLIFSLAILTVACGTSQTAEPPVEFLSIDPIEQQVEYGVSLDEWDEAVNGTSEEETANSADETVTVASEEEAVSSTSEETVNSTEVATETEAVADAPQEELIIITEDGYREIMWDALVPADFTADAIMAKYESELAMFQDGEAEGEDLFAKMQEEFDNAPVNQELNDTLIRLPGFITPLDYDGDVITEFLLVPYYGACMHVPAPPANQTILVTTTEENGVKVEDSYYPVWIMGRLTTDGATTDLAQAGYVIADATVAPYEP